MKKIIILSLLSTFLILSIPVLALPIGDMFESMRSAFGEGVGIPTAYVVEATTTTTIISPIDNRIKVEYVGDLARATPTYSLPVSTYTWRGDEYSYHEEVLFLWKGGTCHATSPFTFRGYNVYSDLGSKDNWARLVVKNAEGTTIDTQIVDEGDTVRVPGTDFFLRVHSVSALMDGTIVGADVEGAVGFFEFGNKKTDYGVNGRTDATTPLYFEDYELYVDLGSNDAWARVIIKSEGDTVDTIIVNKNSCKTSVLTGLTICLMDIDALMDGTVKNARISVRQSEGVPIRDGDVIYEFVFDETLTGIGSTSVPNYTFPVAIELMGREFLIVGASSASTMRVLQGKTGTITASTGLTYGDYTLYSDLGSNNAWARVVIKDSAGNTADTLLPALTESLQSAATGLTIMPIAVSALMDGTVVGVDIVVGDTSSGIDKTYDVTADTTSTGTASDRFPGSTNWGIQVRGFTGPRGTIPAGSKIQVVYKPISKEYLGYAGRLDLPNDFGYIKTTSSSGTKCTNHAQCSQACSSLCAENVYGCCDGCSIGQCQNSVCKCVETSSYCKGVPTSQVGSSCVEPSCTDTDGGIEYYIKGTASTHLGEVAEDVCKQDSWTNVDDPNTIIEMSCSGTGIRSIFYECPNGCEDGACKTASTDECTDTDGGVNYYVAGIVYTRDQFSSGTFYDRCQSGSNTLKEWYCKGTTQAIVYKECEYGCIDDACVRAGDCMANYDCGPEEFCEFETGACIGPGVCSPKPEICAQVYEPVCGCNGETIMNDCSRQAAGVAKRSDGECEEDCAAEGESINGDFTTAFADECCGDLTAFVPEDPYFIAGGGLCINPTKGVPVCRYVDTDVEGWYYTDPWEILTRGACHFTETCTESDDGVDYYNFGTTEACRVTSSGGGCAVSNDHCNGATLTEYSCPDETAETTNMMDTTTFRCPLGCKGGRCLSDVNVIWGDSGVIDGYVHLCKNITVPRTAYANIRKDLRVNGNFNIANDSHSRVFMASLDCHEKIGTRTYTWEGCVDCADGSACQMGIGRDGDYSYTFEDVEDGEHTICIWPSSESDYNWHAKISHEVILETTTTTLPPNQVFVGDGTYTVSTGDRIKADNNYFIDIKSISFPESGDHTVMETPIVSFQVNGGYITSLLEGESSTYSLAASGGERVIGVSIVSADRETQTAEVKVSSEGWILLTHSDFVNSGNYMCAEITLDEPSIVKIRSAFENVNDGYGRFLMASIDCPEIRNTWAVTTRSGWDLYGTQTRCTDEKCGEGLMCIMGCCSEGEYYKTFKEVPAGTHTICVWPTCPKEYYNETHWWTAKLYYTTSPLLYEIDEDVVVPETEIDVDPEEVEVLEETYESTYVDEVECGDGICGSGESSDSCCIDCGCAANKVCSVNLNKCVRRAREIKSTSVADAALKLEKLEIALTELGEDVDAIQTYYEGQGEAEKAAKWADVGDKIDEILASTMQAEALLKENSDNLTESVIEEVREILLSLRVEIKELIALILEAL